MEGGIALLQEQYDKEVAEEEAKIKEELEDQIESMQEAADEFEKTGRFVRKMSRWMSLQRIPLRLRRLPRPKKRNLKL